MMSLWEYLSLTKQGERESGRGESESMRKGHRERVRKK